MKKTALTYLLLGGILMSSGCDLVDPTEVTNPNLTEEAILNTNNPMTPWVAGVKRQLALTVNAHVTFLEIGSDNYENVQTFYNQNLDNLTIRPQDADINGFQFQLGRLREMADYGLTVVKNADPLTTADQEAELNFYKAYSYLLSGEYFSFLPVTAGGEAVEWRSILGMAVETFRLAESSSNAQISAAASLGIARANYRLGNKAEAVQAANSAISKAPNLVYYAQFDQAQGPVNTMQTALYDRGNFDDLQVLPRMDFLDPKYYFRGASQASPVAIFKIEEAHLILAEAAISDSNLNSAKSVMTDIVNLVGSRERSTFNNNQQDRTQLNPGSRPNNSDVQVRFSPGAPLIEGLVLDRKSGNVTVPTISGTSVSVADIDALNDLDDALETLYLMRQEIFIAEGRRLADMGIKLVISEVEYLANPNIDAGSPGTSPVIPPFIDSIKDELDAFDYDAAAGICTIRHNINRILVENKTSELVLPFH